MGDSVMGNEMFIFLDKLRESGTINMFGAPKVLEESFGLSKKESIKVFQAWILNNTAAPPPYVEMPLDSFNNKFQKFVDREDV
jgi:hypothetical protein